MTGIIILVILGGIVYYFITLYNRFQVLNNGAEATLGQIKVALKKRLDMISQLVDSVKSYANFEKETLERIVNLRTKAFGDIGPGDINEIERGIRDILGNIILTVENYPDLKTSETVKELMGAIQDIETEISRHRYVYNNIVQEYNTKVDTIPSSIVASLLGFRKKEYLEFEEDINPRPDVKWR